MTARTLASLLAAGEVAQLAGPRSYARGVGYHDDGRVELESQTDGRVEALVWGTMPYRVALWVKGRAVDWSCTCPMGEDGEFCKHCVAVALALQKGDDRKKPRGRRKASARRSEVDVGDYVRSLDASELADLVMEQVDTDWRLRERLTARAAASAGSGIDERFWRRRLEAAFEPLSSTPTGWPTAPSSTLTTPTAGSPTSPPTSVRPISCERGWPNSAPAMPSPARS